MDIDKIDTLILAGGKGLRMDGDCPKVLRKLSGKPLIIWTLFLLKSVGLKRPIIVTSYKSEPVINELLKSDYDAIFAKQRKPLGTANAVKAGLTKVSKTADHVLVIYGDDSALYKAKTIKALLRKHLNGDSPITILVFKSQYPLSVGGIERNKEGEIIDVLSYDELIKSGSKNCDILCGVFCFNKNWLSKNIKRIRKGKLRGEYPLPALIKMAADEKKYAKSYSFTDYNQWHSINTLEDLKKAQSKKDKTIK